MNIEANKIKTLSVVEPKSDSVIILSTELLFILEYDVEYITLESKILRIIKIFTSF